MSQDSLGLLPSIGENGAFPADTAAGAHPSSSPSPTQLVPDMQRSFHALMHAIFEPNTGATELDNHVTSLVVAAKQLEHYLNSWTQTDKQDELSVEQQLVADVSELEAELRQKDRLLAHYSGRMTEWAERYRQLEASNDEVQDSIYAIDEQHALGG